MYALVAAGARAPQELRERGIQYIPLLEIDGESILARTCRCLREGAGCSSIYVVAPEDVPLPELPGVSRVVPSGNIVRDSMACLRRDRSATHVLVSSADMPVLTPEAAGAVIAAGLASVADLLYPVCRREVIEARFPQTRRTYLRTREGQVSGGNMFCLRREWFLGQEEFFNRAFELRKNKLALARLVGLPLLLAVASGKASLAWIERYVGGRLQGKMCCSVLDYPELAVDLDKVADLELFSASLARPAGG